MNFHENIYNLVLRLQRVKGFINLPIQGNYLINYIALHFNLFEIYCARQKFNNLN